MGKRIRRTGDLDPNAGRYVVLSTPGGQPGVEKGVPIVVERLRALRRAKAADYARNAAYEDPRLVAEVVLGFAALDILFLVGSEIAHGLAGLDPLNVFTNDNGGGVTLADLNPVPFLNSAGSGLAQGIGGGVPSSSPPPSGGGGGGGSRGGVNWSLPTITWTWNWRQWIPPPG